MHELADAEASDAHAGGWRFQLPMFGNVVANEVFAGAAKAVGAWFDAWAIADNELREKALSALVTAGIRFRGRYAVIEGLADLTAHTEAMQKFMPGMRMARKEVLVRTENRIGDVIQ